MSRKASARKAAVKAKIAETRATPAKKKKKTQVKKAAWREDAGE